MTTYTVQLVGEPAQPIHYVELSIALPHYAVAEVAKCDPLAVGLPIWRAEPRSRTGGTTRSAEYHQQYDVECYMPHDNSGRQWLVREA